MASKDYLRRYNIHHVIDAVVSEVAFKQPHDPFIFMVEWLQNAIENPGETSDAVTGVPQSASIGLYISLEDVAQHKTKDDCWIVIENKVYNVTDWLDSHPGGADAILELAGRDATSDFLKIHSSLAKELLPVYYIGDLDPSVHKSFEPPAIQVGGMTVDDFLEFRLAEVRPCNHNSKIFRFHMRTKTPWNIELCCHIECKIPQEGGHVVRAYTPINGGPGYFDLLVKRYPKGPGSSFIHQLKIGSRLACRGPIPSDFAFQPKQHKCLGMLAAGTGITPMMQILRQLAAQPATLPPLTLIYCNRTEDDVLLEWQIGDIAKHSQGQLTVHHLFSKPRDTAADPKGHLTEALVQEWMPFEKGAHLLICGKSEFNATCLRILPGVGYLPSMWTVFESP